MIAYRILVLAAVAASVAACTQAVLPRPDYTSVKPPAPYRVSPDGLRIDNEDFTMDAQGYRLDKKGERIGEVGLVQHLQAGTLPVASEFVDHRIAACAGQARVEHLDDHVNLRERLGRLLAGGGHVAGKPSDGHV